MEPGKVRSPEHSLTSRELPYFCTISLKPFSKGSVGRNQLNAWCTFQVGDMNGLWPGGPRRGDATTRVRSVPKCPFCEEGLFFGLRIPGLCSGGSDFPRTFCRYRSARGPKVCLNMTSLRGFPSCRQYPLLCTRGLTAPRYTISVFFPLHCLFF